MKKTADQIANEIYLLKEVKKTVPEYSFFGDSNWGMIEAQIRVLSEGMSEAEVEAEFGEEEEQVLLSATQAYDWREGLLNCSLTEDWE